MAKPSVFGESGASLTAFSEPANEDRDDFTISEHVGKTVILNVVGVETIKTNSYGDKPAVRFSKIVVLGARGAKVYEDALVFSAAVVGQFRNLSGAEAVVATVATYDSKFGTKGYKFETPSDADLAAASAYLEA